MMKKGPPRSWPDSLRHFDQLIAERGHMKPSLLSRVREWLVKSMWSLSAKFMRRRQWRIEAKARDQMVDKIANAWKTRGDE